MGAMERAELYFAAFPGSPSAVRRPALSRCSSKWVATLGRDRRNRIVGLGRTVEEALRAFDAQYIAFLTPPGDSIHWKAGKRLSLELKTSGR